MYIMTIYNLLYMLIYVYYYIQADKHQNFIIFHHENVFIDVFLDILLHVPY